MYRPPIGPVSAIERAIVCMRMPGLADLRQPISGGFCTQLQAVAPRLFLRALRKEACAGRRHSIKELGMR